jgi:DNA polymerase I-like protein with 3'-5' exonuclease and polymerase domains
VLRSDDKREVVKAERQAISFRIQGSAAEMTKLAEGRMWLSDLLDKHDCEYIASIHDEVLWSVAVDDLVEFLPKAHALMVENYAGMRLPIGSSCSIGWNFGEQVELKGDYSERNIKKALKL